MSRKKMMKARCLLLAREPWYGHAAAAMKWVEHKDTKTMSVHVPKSGLPVCRFGPDFVQRCSVHELATVIMHEIEHIVRQHCSRMIRPNRKLANIACDMVINGHKHSPRIGVSDRTGELQIPFKDSIAWMPVGWDLNMTAEECYSRLLSNAPPEWEKRIPDLLDDHSDWKLTPTTTETSTQAAAMLANAASNAADAPEHLRASISDLNAKPHVDWRAMLRRFVKGSQSRRRVSWSRRNRRVDVFGLPGYKVQRKHQVSVVVDVSGSVSNRVLAEFFAEIESLLHQATVSVLCWDSCKRAFVSPYNSGDWLTIQNVGGAGTDMAAPVDWLCQEREQGDCIIMLTDGYCDWPTARSTPFLVVCSSGRGEISEPSWGKIVYLDDFERES